jgi:retron-type reverse transcriptase
MTRTYTQLHAQVYDFSALYRAWERARRGKRLRGDVLAFSAEVGENLLQLQDELRGLTWRPGEYRERMVYEPKPRTIHVAPFRDRIVHQTLCATIAPLFEETFIHDSYACRVGKGSHAAVDRLTRFLRQHNSAYVLKGDLRKYFDSIPHGLIMRELEWRIADGAVLELLRRVLGSYTGDFDGPAGFGPRGVPIGNLTSQWFANIVGNCLDQHAKHELRCKRYIRYMDDFLLLSDSKEELRLWLGEIQRLLDNLGLVLNPTTRILNTAVGVPFLGYRVWPHHRRVLRANLVAGRRRMRRQLVDIDRGVVTGHSVIDSLRSWFAHLGHADTHRLRLSLWREARPSLRGYIC